MIRSHHVQKSVWTPFVEEMPESEPGDTGKQLITMPVSDGRFELSGLGI